MYMSANLNTLDTPVSAWTDTKGIAEHFDMKPNTLRKQRVKQSPTTLPYHMIGGNVRYNIIECEKFVDKNKRDYRNGD